MKTPTQADLCRAREALAEATDRDARQRLAGVASTFEWLLEPPGRPHPAEVAALVVKPDPLDHDHDGRKGGSVAAAPKRKRKK
jgi:hypothetical protein